MHSNISNYSSAKSSTKSAESLSQFEDELKSALSKNSSKEKASNNANCYCDKENNLSLSNNTFNDHQQKQSP